jgi:hypothetical protein
MYSQPRHCRTVSGELRVLAALRAQYVAPRYALDRRLGGRQSHNGF